jgi:hypothetical protein
MKSFVSYVTGFALVAFLVAGLTSCDIGGNNSGRLSLSLTDKPTHDFEAVYITIESIAVHAADDAEGSWNTILNVHKTFNLMELANGVREQLGIVNLDPGHYTQMRIMIGETAISPHDYANYVVDTKEEAHPLKIPSGFQTGIKLVQGFDINENSTTELVFDFDATRSIVVAGNSGKYLLKPTIHMIDDSQVRTVIKGNVMTMEDAGLEGANVSLQVYTPMNRPPDPGQDLKDEVAVLTSTVTDPEGAYIFFFLDVPDPTTFNLVATNWPSAETDYVPQWDQIPDAVNGNQYLVDFKLPVAAAVGTLGLKAIVADEDAVKNPEPETVVTVSIRQISDLAGNPLVEVKSVPIIGYDDEYLFTEITAVDVELPVGTYTVVASTPGRASLEQIITITEAGPNELEFTFILPTI